jgi:undecaprenyl diphosphate synthase
MELPKHVGIIMDGNGRWATSRGLKRSMGHKKGAETLEILLEHIYNLGIPYVSIYAFSTENFKREKYEVDYLMNLFVKMFTVKKKIFIKNELKVIFSGRRDNLRDDVRNGIIKLEEETKDFTSGTLNICLNYGGRYEIIDMTKKIANLVKEKKIDISSIDEELVNKYMYQELPPLDFVIRTSGEKRVSNFMLWQASYAEYYFPKTLFPDFTPIEFDKAMREYQKRHRRFGGK